MESQSVFDRCVQDHRSALEQIDSVRQDVLEAANILIDCIRAGKTVLLAGNGGSASDAQHIAGEFVGRFLLERSGSPAIALNAMDATLTSIGNDYGYEQVFARQVEAFRSSAGALILYSTSGNSPNILAAASKAKEHGIPTIALAGRSGGKLKAISDVCICIPSDQTPRIQEMHLLVGHIICELVEPSIV